MLRLIKAREATLVKSGEQAVVLEMPTPGDAAMAGMGSPIPGLTGIVPPGGLPALQGGIANGSIQSPGAQQRQRRQR